MRIAICRLTSEISVVGSRGSVRVGPGAEVDLDQVVGDVDGAPCTLADALGQELLASFELAPPASAEQSPARVSRASRRGQDERE